MKKLILSSILVAICSLSQAQNSTGLALSGKVDNPGTYTFEKSATWLEQKKVAQSWSKFDKHTLSQERQWAKDNVADKHDLVFYPFGGPDITHPLQFFPEAKEYILFGMEPVGELFDIEKSSEAEFASVAKNVNVAIKEVIGRNFFITHKMAHQVKTNKAGVASMLLFFLSSNGAQIDKAQVESFKGVNSVTIDFTQAGVKKSVTYYNADISNEGLAKKSEFKSWLEEKLKTQKHSTMVKAASYLMWNKGFSQVKSMVIDNSETVLMDSSAFPVSSFDAKKWNVNYFGNYQKPIDSFKWAVDEDLKKHFEKNTAPNIPFYYGYNNGGRDNILILAKKK